MRTDLKGEARCRDAEEGVRALRAGLRAHIDRQGPSRSAPDCWKNGSRYTAPIGREALLSMGGKQASYTYEQKVAAASAVVDGGATKAEAMAEFGIMSLAPLEMWCRLYREGGAEALRPRPKGRPKGSRAEPRELTREQELEERCRRLEAEVAYLKKLRALVERDGL